MPISVTQYRITIGVYNYSRSTYVCSFKYLTSISYFASATTVIFCSTVLLILSGDIELNPGPFHYNISNGLKICPANVGGLRGKLSAVKYYLIGNFDIIAITESRLASFSDNSKLKFDNYYQVNDFRYDRTTDTGGGIIVFISESLGADRRHEYEDPDVEVIFIEIRSKGQKFLLCATY